MSTFFDDSQIVIIGGHPKLPPNEMLPPAVIFCIMAYTENPNEVTSQNKGLSNIEAAVQSLFPTCSVVWSANTTYDDNYAFVVKSPQNQFFLAIRGSLPFYVDNSVVIDWGIFANWILEDFDMVTQQPWTYTTSGDTAYIASGSMTTFENLSTVLNYPGDAGQVTAAEYLASTAVAGKFPVYITGHSLGGNAATVYASFFANEYPAAETYLFTFAAPTPGDQTFVDDLAAKFPTGKAYHYASDNDIVPRFPVVSNAPPTETVQDLANLYVPQPLASTLDYGILGDLIAATADGIKVLIDTDIINPYIHAPQTTATNAVSSVWSSPSMEDWFLQAAYQHSPYNYLNFLWNLNAPSALHDTLAPFTPKLERALPLA